MIRNTLYIIGIVATMLAPARADMALSFFSGPNAPEVWSGPGVASVSPQADLRGNATGIALQLPLRRLPDRAYWDAAVSLDLRTSSSFSLDVQIDDPEAVRSVSLYFRSGDGWYGGWFKIENSHWKTITLSRADFQAEGTPAGWDQITTLRIAFWKGSAINTTARIVNFRAHNVPILILRNTDARQNKPQDADFANRLTDRLQMWFRQYGIASSIITDEELRETAPPQGTKLIVLPYNPVLTSPIAQRLSIFTDQGGKLIVAYTLNDFIASLMGLESWQWVRAEPSDAFAFMRFHNPDRYAFPERVAQDSWNINRPVPRDARVLATWENGQGIDSGIPAVTLSEHGVFLGHVLTNAGREEKMQMLMATIAMLTPALTPQLSEAMIAHATSLLEHTDWESTKTYITKTARRHHRHQQIQQELEAIDRDITRLLTRAEHLHFPQAATHARSIAGRIRETYYASLSARNAARNEFRGVWAHQAQGIRGMPWSESMQTMQAVGINNLFANVLWAGAAFYPSDILPDVSRGNDYAREVVTAGKKHNISVHAWMALWSLQYAPDEFIADMRHENRLQANRNGNELVWLCPSHPDNRSLTLQAVQEVISRYAFAGFHADYIRFHDDGSCYCSGCRSRFSSTNNVRIEQWPHDVTTGHHRDAWQDWRRAVINTMMQEIHQTVKQVNDDILVSAAVWPGWPAVRDSIAQDWPDWGRQGWVDFFTPMNYVHTAEEAVRFYRSQRAAVARHIPIYPGLAPSTHNLTPATTLQHIDALRDADAPGFVLFDLDRDLLKQHLPALGAGATSP